jgi:hypothetical protein
VVEDQGAGQQELQGADTVGLEYRPTVGDFASAFRARRGVSRASRRQFWILGCFAVLFALQMAAHLTGGEAAPFPLFVGMSVYGFLILLTPWLQARQFHRFAERMGTFRVTVTESGVTVTSDNTTASVNWAAQSRYRETADVFVMFSPDKNAIAFTVLPKRAVAAPADVDRLRTILDRNLSRV